MTSPLCPIRKQSHELLTRKIREAWLANEVFSTAPSSEFCAALELLDRPELYARQAGIRLLAVMGEEAALRLCRMLDPDQPASRLETLLEAIGRTGEERAVPAVKRMEASGARRVRQAAVRALRGLAASPEPFLSSLLDEDWTVRREAVFALSQFHGGETSFLAERMLSDAHAMVRSAAANVLGIHRSLHSSPRLLEALSDPFPSVREKAEWALRRLSAPLRDLESLLATLERASESRRPMLVEALGNFSDEEAVSALIAHSRPAAIGHTRRNAVFALGRTRHPRAIERLASIVGSPERSADGIANCAAVALAVSGALPTVRALASAASSDARALAVRALGFMRAADAAETLYAALLDESPLVREEAAMALTRIKLHAGMRRGGAVRPFRSAASC